MKFNVALFIVLQVIIIDAILSLDNAAVLGAMAARLSPSIPAPLAPWFRRMLGKNQQEAALKVGLLGAYVGRSLMLFLGGVIIAFPLLKVLGALYLLNLVVGHFEIYEKIDRSTGIFTFLDKVVEPIKRLPGRLGLKNNTGFLGSSLQGLVASPFWRIVITVEFMDLVFSLDNVIAVLALSEYIVILIIGVCISILIMRFAATQFLKLINLEPLLVHAAYILILAISIELFLKFLNIEIGAITQFVVSMAIIIGFIAFGQIGRKRGWIKPKEDGAEEASMVSEKIAVGEEQTLVLPEKCAVEDLYPSATSEENNPDKEHIPLESTKDEPDANTRRYQNIMLPSTPIEDISMKPYAQESL